ncbi:tipE homolog 4 phospholipid transfer protein [Lycorma delicatula]|uniref:tipE homolog 4 phospholipid transfer protein n=1 Tax=Lycorma delicatula TaxID=130591 RepID=UPI003F517E18
MGRRRKDKPRLIPEQDRRICGSICLCQLTLVLSCVSMVYLAVAVYMPSHEAFHAGIDPTPVMCQAIKTTMVNNCDWASCGEWCLTKTSGFCPQIHVTARRNGTDIVLDNCTRLSTVSCPQVNTAALKRYNCNNDTECSTLTGVFNCSLGHCANMSELFLCHHKADGIVVDSDKDNLKLNGFFECYKSKCTKIKRQFTCDRYCNKITTSGRNVFIQYEDDVYTGHCRSARTSDDGVELWSDRDNNSILLASCLDVKKLGPESLKATDCLNGTVLEETNMPQPFVNFTIFWKIVADSKQPVDPDQRYMPMQQLLTIYNSSRLLINLEGCVNTLKGECKQFLHTHGRDGRNDTAQSRFPCFINKNDSFRVVARFDLDKTRRDLLVAVVVPLSLFCISLTSLVIIAHSVQVGDDARMRWKFRKQKKENEEEELPMESVLHPSESAAAVERAANSL